LSDCVSVVIVSLLPNATGRSSRCRGGQTLRFADSQARSVPTASRSPAVHAEAGCNRR